MSIAPAISDWFRISGRDLPWRRPGFTAWGTLVSEVMLQQTPVSRVIPRLEEWLERWPTPADLAAVPSGEAVRAWNRLGYPRRALNLHAAIHDGSDPIVVPRCYRERHLSHLVLLGNQNPTERPGTPVGSYTLQALPSVDNAFANGEALKVNRPS